MKKIGKYAMVFMLAAITVFRGVPAEAETNNINTKSSKLDYTIMKVCNETDGMEETLVVKGVVNGCIITSPIQKNIITASGCRHTVHIPVGQPYATYRKETSTKHRKYKAQKTVCMQCKQDPEVLLLEDQGLYPHFFVDNKCVHCKYKKK